MPSSEARGTHKEAATRPVRPAGKTLVQGGAAAEATPCKFHTALKSPMPPPGELRWVADTVLPRAPCWGPLRGQILRRGGAGSESWRPSKGRSPSKHTRGSSGPGRGRWPPAMHPSHLPAQRLQDQPPPGSLKAAWGREGGREGRQLCWSPGAAPNTVLGGGVLQLLLPSPTASVSKEEPLPSPGEPTHPCPRLTASSEEMQRAILGRGLGCTLRGTSHSALLPPPLPPFPSIQVINTSLPFPAQPRLRGAGAQRGGCPTSAVPGGHKQR